MTIKNNFNCGDFVFIKHDPEQIKFMVIGVLVRGNCISYELMRGDIVQWCRSFEISKNKDYSLN